MGKFLDELQEFAGPIIKSRDIKIAGKSKTVWFREVLGDEAEAIFADLRDESGKVPTAKNGELWRRIVAVSACDEAGASVLSYDEVCDLAQNRRQLYAQLLTHAQNINGLGADEEDAKN